MLLYCTVWGWKGPAERGGNSACGCLMCWRKQEKRERNSREQYTKKDVKIVAHGDVPRISAVEQLNLASMYTRQSQRLAGRISEFFSTTHTRCSFFPSRQGFLNLFVLCANPMLVIVCYGRIESLHVTMDDS